jgi:hypothetical protein
MGRVDAGDAPARYEAVAGGNMQNKADQAACGQYVTSYDWRYVDWSAFDPSLKPMSQREIFLLRRLPSANRS